MVPLFLCALLEFFPLLQQTGLGVINHCYQVEFLGVGKRNQRNFKIDCALDFLTGYDFNN